MPSCCGAIAKKMCGDRCGTDEQHSLERAVEQKPQRVDQIAGVKRCHFQQRRDDHG